MRVGNLYKNLDLKVNHIISKVVSNSKEAINDSIFVAIKGYCDNGEKYIDEAIELGAKTIITSSDFVTEKNINVIKVKDPKKELGRVLKKLNSHKLKNFKLIAVTGTNGKTTVVNLLYRYFKYLNLPVILFSSNGNYVMDQYYSTNNTTPDILTIYNTILNSNLKKGFVIIEVSSQAISEKRVFDLLFDVVCITNISHDHLDYHCNLTDYFYTKCLLMYQTKEDGIIVLNGDDEKYSKLLSLAKNNVVSFGTNFENDYRYEIVDTNIDKTLFFIEKNPSSLGLETMLIGEFNIKNILCTYTIIDVLGITLEKFKSFIRSVERIEGRMNVYTINHRQIIIDYAHTPIAVQTILKTIKEIKNTTLRLVIGCGGNRDRLKRPLIGKISCEYADYVYFTEDNSRNENVNKILNEITCDLTTRNYTIIESRYKAINKAILDSKFGDTIVIMGKGIEKTKVDETRYLSDLEIVLEIFKRLNNE